MQPGYDVDALRLLRTVRVSRELRLLWRLALFALPVWVATMAIIQASAPDDAKIQDEIDEIALPSLGWILVVAAVALTAHFGIRFVGPSGAIARRLVPVAGLGWEADRPAGTHAERALVARLGRRGWLSFGALVLVLAFVPATGAVAYDFWPAFRANHGHGGRVVTIGKDAHIAYSETGSHGHPDYYLDTPDGPAIAEDSRPQDGQRWTVVDNPFGNDMAYEVGAHDYLLLLFVMLGVGTIGVGSATFAFGQIRREHRRRRSDEHAPLADAVQELAGGGRIALTLRVRTSASMFASRASRKTPEPIEVSLGLAPLAAGRTVATLLLRRRLLASAGAVIVLGAATTLVVLWRAGVLRSPPLQRDVTLTYLAGTGWQPVGSADYSHQGDGRFVAEHALEEGGVDDPHLTGYWTVLIHSTNLHKGIGVTAYVDLEVVGIGSAPAERATAGAVAEAESDAHALGTTTTVLTGLPAGWRGVLTAADDSDGPIVDAVGSENGRMLELELRLDRVTPAATAVERGTNDIRALAAALARRGIAHVADDTARR